MLRPYKANIVQQLAAQKTCATFRYSKVDGEVDMRDGWRTCKLYEVVERFIDYRGKTPRKTTSGIPLITAKIVKDGFINDPEEFIAEEDYDSWMRRGLPMKGDVVLTTEAPLGEVAQIRTNERVALAQRIITLRGKKDILANAFLKFALQGPIMQQRLHARASGSTVQGIKNSELQKVEIELPPFSIQRRIAEILGALDDKIECNRRINQTLEQMAMALYKHWFVDFGPFRDGEFVDSELGRIPKGWKVDALGNHLDIAKGLSYKGSGLSESGNPLHNLNSIYEGGGYKYEGIKYYTGDYKDRHILYPGDVIVANTEQGFEYLLIGCPAIVPKRYGLRGLFTHHLFRVRPLSHSPITSHFIYLLLKEPRFRSEVTCYTNGTTVNMLSEEGLKLPLFVVPPRKIIERFESVISPRLKMIEVNYDESETLARTRGYLLPKLLSGEIEVKAAEDAVEDLI